MIYKEITWEHWFDPVGQPNTTHVRRFIPPLHRDLLPRQGVGHPNIFVIQLNLQVVPDNLITQINVNVGQVGIKGKYNLQKL